MIENDQTSIALIVILLLQVLLVTFVAIMECTYEIKRQRLLDKVYEEEAIFIAQLVAQDKKRKK